jgi:primosomal protein N' (replication factor Y)
MARKRTHSDEPDLFSSLEPASQHETDIGAASLPVPLEAAPTVFQNPHKHLAEVAVEGPVRGTFTYAADNVWNDLVYGARVLVPFGHRTATGFFVAERTDADLLRENINPAKLKSIIRVLDQDARPQRRGAPQITISPEERNAALLTPVLLDLARWMARHYACPLGTTLASMLPAGVKRGAEAVRVRMVSALLTAPELLAKAEELSKKKPKQAALLLALAAIEEPIAAADLLQDAGAPDSALKALEKAGVLRVIHQHFDADGEPEALDDENADSGAGEVDLVLNGEQQAALTEIESALLQPDKDAPSIRNFLLQGVTGSGKTEVYLRALKTALAQNKQAIVLVPEIALTPQTAQRFERRLGRERVAVLHSHITDGERAEAWRAVRAGKIDVVVGARSALFAPLPRLGIIVIDEEHENAFKQESTPRYHARDVAMELARLSGAALVLGSATPSFESIYATKTGRMKLLMLSQRVAGRPMPPVEVIDMNRENREVERYSYLSRKLTDAIAQTLQRGEQTILFMNRRGFATVITCVKCGHTEKCEQCDISLTSHRGGNSSNDFSRSRDTTKVVTTITSEFLTCHYCNFTKPVPDVCSGCGAPGVKHWGMGTERVENEVKKLFPSARVARMDSDTMNKRTAYLDALGSFRARKTDILVGTQMIAKGLDFPNVTLVGVVMADTALHMPDFRSRERTFQLLAQVAGRAGRGDKGGKVIIQTHLPGDPAIRAAAHHDFETFALAELKERRAYNYPPFTRLARILVRGKDLAITRAAAEQAADAIKNSAQKTQHAGLSVLGPAEAPLARLEGQFRQHIMIKAPSSEVLAEILSGPAADTIAKLKGADAVIDVDALSML